MEECQGWGCPAVAQSHSLASAPGVGWVTGQDSCEQDGQCCSWMWVVVKPQSCPSSSP